MCLINYFETRQECVARSNQNFKRREEGRKDQRVNQEKTQNLFLIDGY